MSSETIGQGELDLKALDEYLMSDESPVVVITNAPKERSATLATAELVVSLDVAVRHRGGDADFQVGHLQ